MLHIQNTHFHTWMVELYLGLLCWMLLSHEKMSSLDRVVHLQSSRNILLLSMYIVRLVCLQGARAPKSEYSGHCSMRDNQSSQVNQIVIYVLFYHDMHLILIAYLFWDLWLRAINPWAIYIWYPGKDCTWWFFTHYPS